MNQRIKELMEQAGFDPAAIERMGVMPQAEKFAELIVRECMEVSSPSYLSTPEQGVYYVEQAINRIAEHFGVEE